MSATPNRITVRMYQVGFGDCFLLSFTYQQPLADGRRKRHMLIDFGSTRWPKDFHGRYPDIAADIAAQTDGKLDVLAITHRHKDHIGGFANNQAAAAIAALTPSLVLRPWTEDPQAAADATAPHLLGQRSFSYAEGLASAQDFAAEVARRLPGDQRGFSGQLAAIAIEQLANQDAISELDKLATSASAGARYLFAGQPSGIDDLIPGVKTTVLGPPTIDQWPAVAGERADDPEYWLRQRTLLGRMLKTANASPALIRVADSPRRQPTDPGPLRWIVERMHDQQTHSLLRIVTTLEDALNNTSLILQFETGIRKLLFPGDAQIENWSYALTAPKAAALRAHLADIDFYKVGHHGSRNASPRSLIAKWTPPTRPFAAMMSTLPNVHGETEATAVPRRTLTDALKLIGPLYRTDELPPNQPSLAVTASTRNRQPFVAIP